MLLSKKLFIAFMLCGLATTASLCAGSVSEKPHAGSFDWLTNRFYGKTTHVNSEAPVNTVEEAFEKLQNHFQLHGIDSKAEAICVKDFLAINTQDFITAAEQRGYVSTFHGMKPKKNLNLPGTFSITPPPLKITYTDSNDRTFNIWESSTRNDFHYFNSTVDQHTPHNWFWDKAVRSQAAFDPFARMLTTTLDTHYSISTKGKIALATATLTAAAATTYAGYKWWKNRKARQSKKA